MCSRRRAGQKSQVVTWTFPNNVGSTDHRHLVSTTSDLEERKKVIWSKAVTNLAIVSLAVGVQIVTIAGVTRPFVVTVAFPKFARTMTATKHLVWTSWAAVHVPFAKLTFVPGNKAYISYSYTDCYKCKDRMSLLLLVVFHLLLLKSFMIEVVF